MSGAAVTGRPTNPNGTTPALTPAEREEIGAFWQVYDAHYEEIGRDLRSKLADHPELGPLMRALPEAEQIEQDRQLRVLLCGAVVDGDWTAYLEHLSALGAGYAAAGLSFSSWFDAISELGVALLPSLLTTYAKDAARQRSSVLGMIKYVGVVMAVIGEAYLQAKENVIRRQQDAIQEIATPVLRLRDRLLILPIVGGIDTQRARQITEGLLNGIRDSRARVVVIDITGVPAVDSAVANHLIQTVDAARLMGTTVIVTGLSPEIAQTLVTIGVDLSRLRTVGDLQGGIEEAERLLVGRAGDNSAPSRQS